MENPKYNIYFDELLMGIPNLIKDRYYQMDHIVTIPNTHIQRSDLDAIFFSGKWQACTRQK
jgi:hypothetical protein